MQKQTSHGVKHIAIIMDGNGRWAKKRGKPRFEGHRVGMEKIRDAMDWCKKRSIEVLTLYAFSAQNWNRPAKEVNFLMGRFEKYLDAEIDSLMENKVRLKVIGRVEGLPSRLQEKIRKVEEQTNQNRALNLNLAINYGGQEEIVDAAKKIANLLKRERISPEDIHVEEFKKYLYTPHLPYPDLVIRTGGEFRISNFLLWQIAYSELWITFTYWPDFDERDLDKALSDFSRRERRFGAIRGE